jgi:hypothetical protein
MKTNKNSKSVITLLLLYSFIASAYIWLVCVFVIVIVAGAIAISMVQTIRRVLPDPAPAPTNHVTRVFMNDGRGEVLSYSTFGTNDPAWQPPIIVHQSNVKGFNLQYGITDVPWVDCKQTPYYSIISNPFNIVITPEYTAYSVTFIGNGDYVQMNFDSVNNWTWNIIDSSTNTYIISIERSTNMVNWETVMVNTNCFRYTVENWTDVNNLPLAVYRTRMD